MSQAKFGFPQALRLIARNEWHVYDNWT